MKRNDTAIIILVILITAITAYNSRFNLTPTPPGHTRYNKHGITTIYPEDLYPWEIAIKPDGKVILDGSTPISRDTGNMGWNSGNKENPPDTNHFRECSTIWLKTDPPETPRLDLYYTAQYDNNQRRHREMNMTKGTTESYTHRNHQVTIQYFNFTTPNIGTSDQVQIYGIVGSYYCTKTGRTIVVYYLDIYDTNPIYNHNTLYESFRFYIDHIHSY